VPRPTSQPPRHRARAALFACGLALLGSAGCARPYSGPKTLAAIAAGLLVTGGGAWVVGDRGGRESVAAGGALTAAIGAASVIAAGGWLAASIACSADPDCPSGEECKEIPAQPGKIPYKQCMRR
jgi:hypothetical protein